MNITENEYYTLLREVQYRDMDEDLAEAMDSLADTQEALLESLDFYNDIVALNAKYPDATLTDIITESAKIDSFDTTIKPDIRDFVDNIMYQAEYSDEGKLRKKAYDVSYKPAPGMGTVKSITEMKFPANIIFLITQIINWIGNIVRYVISRITNVLRYFVGLKTGEMDDGLSLEDALKIDLKDTKTIKTMGLDALDDGKGYNKASNDFIKLYKMNPGELNVTINEEEDLTEGATLSRGVVEPRDDDKTPKKVEFVNYYNDFKDKLKHQGYVITLDLSGSFSELTIAVKRTLELFDNAWGSQGEYLFGTEDLESVLALLQSCIREVKEADVRTYTLGSEEHNFNEISKDRIKANLLRTSANVENLKKAFVDLTKISEGIIEKIENEKLKSFMATENSYTIFTSQTYAVMTRLNALIEPKIKSANKMIAGLEKMERSYNKICEELKVLKGYMMGFSTLAINSNVQTQINNLYESARYMTNIVTLRLTCLTVVTQALTRTKDLLYRAAGISSTTELSRWLDRVRTKNNIKKAFSVKEIKF